jgi:hypothetical protein
MNARDLIIKLRSNGGKLATAAADCIEDLLSQLPTPKERGKLDPRHEAIVLLFQGRLNKPVRDKKETAVFNTIKHMVTEEDMNNCQRFLSQPEPKGFHKLLSARKKTPITFMRDYVNQTDLATEWCRLNPPAPDPHATKFPEPKGWQAHAPGNLGERSWTLVCKQYPDIAEGLHGQLKPEAN